MGFGFFISLTKAFKKKGWEGGPTQPRGFYFRGFIGKGEFRWGSTRAGAFFFVEMRDREKKKNFLKTRKKRQGEKKSLFKELVGGSY